MHDSIFNAFLTRQLADARRLAAESDLVDFMPVHQRGAPPANYVVALRCKGLARDPHGRIVETEPWAFAVRFPSNYLRAPVDVASLLCYLGPHPDPFHPNILAPSFVCMKIAPGAPLTEVAMGLFELLTWNVYSTGDALNFAAAQWARNQDPRRFPVDGRPLKRRPLLLDVQPLAPEARP